MPSGMLSAVLKLTFVFEDEDLLNGCATFVVVDGEVVLLLPLLATGSVEDGVSVGGGTISFRMYEASRRLPMPACPTSCYRGRQSMS